MHILAPITSRHRPPEIDILHTQLFHGRIDPLFATDQTVAVRRSITSIPHLSKPEGSGGYLVTHEFADSLASVGVDFAVREARITRAYELAFTPGGVDYRDVPGYDDANEQAFDLGTNDVFMDLFERHRPVLPPDTPLFLLLPPPIQTIRALHGAPLRVERHVVCKQGQYKSLFPVEFAPGLIDQYPLISAGLIQMRDDVFAACRRLIDQDFWWHSYVNDRDLDDPANPFANPI